jgi:hypothetical protein
MKLMEPYEYNALGPSLLWNPCMHKGPEEEKSLQVGWWTVAKDLMNSGRRKGDMVFDWLFKNDIVNLFSTTLHTLKGSSRIDIFHQLIKSRASFQLLQIPTGLTITESSWRLEDRIKSHQL